MTGAEQVERLAGSSALSARHHVGVQPRDRRARSCRGGGLGQAPRRLLERAPLHTPADDGHGVLGAAGEARASGRGVRQGPALGYRDPADRSVEGTGQRLGRGRRRGHGERLPALFPDAGQRRRPRRPARAEPHHREAHDLRHLGSRIAIAPTPGGVLGASTSPSVSASRCVHRTASLRFRARRAISTGADMRGRASGSIPRNSSSASSWCSRPAPCARTIASSSGSSSTRRSWTEPP